MNFQEIDGLGIRVFCTILFGVSSKFQVVVFSLQLQVDVCSILSRSEEDIFLFQIWSHAFKRLTLWFTFKFSLSAAPPQTNVTWVFGIHIGRFQSFCFKPLCKYRMCCINPHILKPAPMQTNATWVFGIHIGRFIYFLFQCNS